MSKPNNHSIWFWQRILTPHMATLAAALAERGFTVTFVANTLLSENRSKLGWEIPKLGKVIFKLAENKDAVTRLALEAPDNSIHLCQGLHSNGLVSNAQRVLRKRSLKHWALMEMVDDFGWLGLLKKALYRIIFLHWRSHLEGVLAIGRNAPTWFIARGMKKNRIYPFAYFLEKPQTNQLLQSSDDVITKRPFRFIFVGRLIKLKKVDHLINAIAALKIKEVEVWIIGNGPEEKYLRSLANLLLPTQVRWIGTLPISKVPNMISQTDCLVLPSRYDGWGAVVSEALMVGTPVICSDACGSSAAVQASGVGSVFSTNDQQALTNVLQKQIKVGHWHYNQRQQVAQWATCLGAESGAEYLDLILNNYNKYSIDVPWLKKNNLY